MTMPDARDAIDLMFNQSPICPHCGHQHNDAFEWADDGEHECYGCGKPFWCHRDIEITYTTSIKESS